MNQLLTRLVERQRALLSAMDELDRPVVRPAKRPPVDSAAENADRTQAEALLAKGRLSEAEELLAPYLHRASSVRTLTSLAKLYTQTHRLDEAVAALQQAEQLGAESKKVWTLLARLYKAKGDAQKEVVYWRRVAFATDDPPVEAYTRLLSALIRSRPASMPLPAGEVKTIIAAFDAVTQRPKEDVLAFARALYPLTVLRERALEMLHEAAPCPPESVDFGAEWCLLAAWCSEHGAEFRRSDAGVPGHRPSVAQLRDVIVDPAFHWIPIVEAGEARHVLLGIYNGKRTVNMEHAGSPLMLDSSDRVELRLPRTLPSISTPAVLLGSDESGFRHLLDRLGALATAHSLGVGLDGPLVTSHAGGRHVELHSLLGIDPARLMTIDGPTRFSELWVATSPTVPGARVDPVLPTWCRSRLSRELQAIQRNAQAVILLCDDPDTDTSMAPVVAAIAAGGVRVVSAARLGLRELVAELRTARVVISVSSEALVNVIFAEPGLEVVQVLLDGSLQHGASDTEPLLTACGHASHRVVWSSKVDAPDSEERLTADRERLFTLVRQVCSDAEPATDSSSARAASALQ